MTRTNPRVETTAPASHCRPICIRVDEFLPRTDGAAMMAAMG
jgi:hypothetical protein